MFFLYEPRVLACPELVEGRETALIAFIATELSPRSKVFSASEACHANGVTYPAVKNIAF